MIRLKLSRRALRAAVWVALALALPAGLYGLGAAVTPVDGEGHCLILSPSLRAAEVYRQRAQAWLEQLAEIDRRLVTLLDWEESNDPAEIVAQGQEMQGIGEMAAAVAGEAHAVEVPVALVGLREQAEGSADAYLEAALLTARWLSGPSEGGWREALETLRLARALRMEMEESRWLKRN